LTFTNNKVPKEVELHLISKLFDKYINSGYDLPEAKDAIEE